MMGTSRERPRANSQWGQTEAKPRSSAFFGSRFGAGEPVRGLTAVVRSKVQGSKWASFCFCQVSGPPESTEERRMTCFLGRSLQERRVLESVVFWSTMTL